MDDREKAVELEKLHFLSKENISTSARHEKMKLLTLAPDLVTRADNKIFSRKRVPSSSFPTIEEGQWDIGRT